jgi:hypothetical protein
VYAISYLYAEMNVHKYGCPMFYVMMQASKDEKTDISNAEWIAKLLLVLYPPALSILQKANRSRNSVTSTLLLLNRKNE